MKKSKVNWREWGNITIAVFIISISVYYFMMPSKVAVGSISGFVMVLTNFLPFPVSVMTFVLNVALLLVGFLTIGKEFGVKTVYTSVMLPVFIRIFEIVTPNPESVSGDIVLDTICFVLIISVGQAMLFNVNASSGGLDIVAKFLNKYFHLEIGKGITIAGFVTASTSALVYDRKTVVVSLLGTYLCGIVLDSFIDGFHIRKKVCILSEKYQEMQKFIVKDLNRGATLYPAYGGYDNKEKIEVVTILTRNEYAMLLGYVHKEDPNAFITVSTVGEVIGRWNENKKRRLRGEI